MLVYKLQTQQKCLIIFVVVDLLLLLWWWWLLLYWQYLVNIISVTGEPDCKCQLIIILHWVVLSPCFSYCVTANGDIHYLHGC